ncbi:MAG: DNA repair protein RecO C-terminal domain-containing protein [Treponema sp.]|nr:DNA repair protein RecO C-terminal domain-containing protein [Treponema sp.]
MAKSLSMLTTVISLKPQGENNSSVCLLTQTEGIIYATLYGGHKSRLKGLCSPWNTGTVWLSQDVKTGFYKISDFSVTKYHLTFRESLTKYYASSLGAELALQTGCAGNAKDFWALFNGFIDGLDLCTDDSQCRTGLVRFLWRFLSLSGLQPDARECSCCSKSFLTNEDQEKSENFSEEDRKNGAEYSVTENQFICGQCKKIDDKSFFYLNARAMSYLAALSSLSPREVRKWPLTESALYQIEELVFYLIESSLGKKLKSLNAGRQFL